MITELELSYGAKTGATPLIFAPGGVTVFVGPNNSGKSLVLREIGSALFDSGYPRFQHVLSWQGFIEPNKRRIVRGLTAAEPEWAHIRPYFTNVDAMGLAHIGSLLSEGHSPSHINPADLLRGVEVERNPEVTLQARQIVRRSQVEILDGQRRLNLVDPKMICSMSVSSFASVGANRQAALFG